MQTEVPIFVRFKTTDTKGKETESVMKQEQFAEKFPEAAEGEEDKFALEHGSVTTQKAECKYPDTLTEALSLYGVTLSHEQAHVINSIPSTEGLEELLNQLGNASAVKQENHVRSRLGASGERAERYEITDTPFQAWTILPTKSQKRRLTDEEKLKKLFPSANEEQLKQAAQLLKNMELAAAAA